MEDTENITIKTERLFLERTTITYVEEIFKEFTDEVTKYLRASTPKNIEEEKQWIERTKEKYNQWTAMSLVVTDTSGAFIWNCEIMHLDTQNPELWLRLKQSARWKGYGKEMIAALIQRLENHKRFDYIIYRACTENIGSRKIAESLGGELQLDEQGNAKILIEHKFDNSSSFEAVEYRIYKK